MGMSRKRTSETPLYTTLAPLKQHGACEDGYKKLLKSLTPAQRKQPNRPIPLARVLESNGIDDALWCLRAVPEHQQERRDRLARLYACDCVERVLPMFEAKHPGEKRPRHAIETTRRFASGEASADELAAARDAAEAAWAAAYAAWAAAEAWAAARAATYAAWAARDAAGDAAWNAAGDAAWAARDAAWAAAWIAAGDAAYAAWAARDARDAAGDAERDWQAAHFKKMFA